MDLERDAADRVTLLDLVYQIGLAVGGGESGDEVQQRTDVVDHAAGLDHARPAHHARDAPAPLPVGVLLAAERRSAAVRPRADLRSVIGGEDDDRIVRDAEFLKL